jgi:hypothetical protein
MKRILHPEKVVMDSSKMQFEVQVRRPGILRHARFVIEVKQALVVGGEARIDVVPWLVFECDPNERFETYHFLWAMVGQPIDMPGKHLAFQGIYPVDGHPVGELGLYRVTDEANLRDFFG